MGGSFVLLLRYTELESVSSELESGIVHLFRSQGGLGGAGSQIVSNGFRQRRRGSPDCYTRGFIERVKCTSFGGGRAVRTI